MLKDQEIKMVPPKPAQNAKQKETKTSNHALWFASMIAVYFILLSLIAVLPLSECMEVLSLILGTLLILDVLHSIKYYVRHRQ